MAQCCGQDAELPVGSRDSNDISQGSEGLGHTTVDLTRSKCSADRPVIQVFQSQPAELKLYVMDRNGEAVDLSNLPDGAVISFVTKDRESSNTLSINADCEIVDAPTGTVKCVLTKTNTKSAGIFVAQVLVTMPDNAVLWQTPYWFVVNLTLNFMSRGAPTIPEIRLIMRDACPAQNTLLDDFEFDDSQIVACMRLPIDEFNEKYQPKTNFNPRTFPYRFHWMRATAGYLLEIMARGYARDHLAYNAGGVAVDDKNKAQAYLNMGQQLIAEWRDFIKSTKIEMNIEMSYRSAGSYYGYTNW